MSEPTGFYCSSCGEWHDELPLNYGADVPDIFYDIPEEERDKRIEANDDFCIVDNQYYFVRGNIEIPIQGADQIFSWGVWVSLSEKNFNRTTSLLDTEGRESEPPYFGWLSTSLPYPESTLNLKTLVHTQPVGIRPFIELEPTSHPLSVEQRQGITLQRVQEFAEHMLHGNNS
jgi:hypothetical protein